MSKLVRDVVQFDLEAQTKIRQLNHEKEELSFELGKKRHQMEKDYQTEMQHIQAMLYEEAQRKMDAANTKYLQKESDLKEALLQRFRVNEQTWLDTVFTLFILKD